MSAVAGQNSKTHSEAAPVQSLHTQAGDQRHVFHADVTIGREGTFVINDEFASGNHGG